MDILFIVLGIICLLVGLVGSIVPMIPGPPIAYGGLLLLQVTEKAPFTLTQLMIWALLVVFIQVLDYFVPLLGSKYIGGSKWGSWGCIVGTIIGLFYPPFGIIVGPFLGALIGELINNKPLKYALRSGIGSLLGFLAGTLLKLILCIYFIYQFIAAL